MKKQHIITGCFIIVTLSTVLPSIGFAQSGTKYATGGNNLSVGDKLGSNNYEDLAFYTNAIQRAVLTKDGRFGIGITAPSVLFHISGGNALFEQNATVNNLLTAGSLVVNGFSTLNGTVSIGSHLTIDGTASTITSTAGNIGFGSSNLNTLGDITADSINGNVLNINSISTNNVVTTNITASGQVQAGSLEVSGNSQLRDVSAQNVQASGLTVNGNAQITGLTNVEGLEATSLEVTGNSQLTNVQADNLQVNDTITTGYLSSNNILTSSINSNQYLLNGSPLTASQWINSGSDIYFNGNVGVNTNSPGFPLHVQGDAGVTGTLFAGKIAVQNAISIGQFRFVNGAVMPGQKDSITSPVEVVVRSEAEKISLEADTVVVKQRLEAQTVLTYTLEAQTTVKAETVEATGEIRAGKGRIDSSIIVAQGGLLMDGINARITSAGGTISFDNENLVTSGSITATDLNISGITSLSRLRTNQILSLDTSVLGLIQFGDSTLYLSTAYHRLLWLGSGLGSNAAQGLTIGNPRFKVFNTGNPFSDFFSTFACWLNQVIEQRAIAPNSIAIGYNLKVAQNADYAIVLGSGLTSGSPNECDLGNSIFDAGTLNNPIPNSMMVGFNSDIPTLFVGPSSGLGTTGQVSIGNDKLIGGPHFDYKLSVDGKIVSKSSFVTVQGWGDYVLRDDYELPSLLEEVEPYIKENNHLFGVPSEKEILENGVDLGNMDAIQMVKIEELTLYTIAQQKQIDAQQKQIDELINELELLKK